MTDKRFTVHIGWFNYDKTEGEITLKDRGQPIHVSDAVDDVQWIKRLLNELNDENEQLKERNKELIGSVHFFYDEKKRLVNKYVEKVMEVEKENEQLKKELYQIDKLIDDLGSEELRRQYEEICGDC